ncbi:multi antimicrobial extrusion protein MatE [Rossellomorea marisflavi]|uniref:multi antimicrobial extrusion protein MatE n=1 Tax=Rossellomorea marisflavi TaxID=189381 RepID=UPI003D2EBA10
MDQSTRFTYGNLAAFFIPLGFSASLTSLTHIIINGTLSRGENAAFIIACYAVAFALFGIIERPIIVFRQTCSTLVKDRAGFKKLNIFMLVVISVIAAFSLLLAYSSLGDWVYITFFNANENMVATISDTFKVIFLVIIFSGIRGIYQGVIISQLETKWLSVMVVIRLFLMFLAAYLFVAFDYVTSMAGAMIFLIGMMVECAISVWKGQGLLNRHYPSSGPGLSMKEISQFYTPLVFYFVIQTLLIPIIYMFLSLSDDIEVSIASFALAYSITQMLLSFFMYAHQLVLQLYEKNKRKVIRFFAFVSLLPSLLLVVLCYTPAGEWFMESVMGADAELSRTTLYVMQFFIFKTLVFPWVDFMNGFLMLKRLTKRMLMAQVMNILAAVVCLTLLIYTVPQWNGTNGAIAVSIGELVGLLAVMYIVRKATVVLGGETGLKKEA